MQLTLTLASLADLSFTCGNFRGFSAASAQYGVSWLEVLDDEDLTGFAYGLDARAETTGFGLTSCITIDYADANGAFGGCQGEVAIIGETIVWALPLRGSEAVDVADEPSGIITHTETRAWDFGAFAGQVRGSSNVNLESIIGNSLTAFRDSATGGNFAP